MLLPTKSSQPTQGRGGTSEETKVPSNTLWVGNLSSDVTQSDLTDLFAQFGALDSVTLYSARCYGFVFFKRMEDAMAAKNALQGTLLRGNSLKIEFARPAKPCKNLWVGGINSTVTKEELEAEFHKLAMKTMNGKCIGGNRIRVDFLRSQSSKRDLSLEKGQFQGQNMGPTGQKIPQYLQSSVGRADGQPSSILCICYPYSVEIDEQMLHNAMILFGEIERIKCYPSRNYAFVEFRSLDEAWRAKEGLQGRLFNDPRIMIMYSSGELAPGKDYPGFYAGSQGPRPDMYLGEHQSRPMQMDVFGHNRPMFPNNIPGQLPFGGIIGPNSPMRPYGPQGSQEPLIRGPELNDLGAHHGYHDGGSKSQMGPQWNRPSPPALGMLPLSGTSPTSVSSSVARDVFDINQCQRDSKRPRIDGALLDNAPFPLRNFEDRGLRPEQSCRIEPATDGGGSVPYVNMHGNTHLAPESSRIKAGVPSPVQPDSDHIWRGIIAKGGTPVCHARCLPVGKKIGIEFPEVVDCTARTGLDMLTKHYADAIGFEIVFFLPDSEDDFASYTEFLCYLSKNNRAGVAKSVEGTTLLLVPPSDFLTKVLKVKGPERLYGVILKFPQAPSGTPMQQLSHLPTPSTIYYDRQHTPYSQAEYGLIPAKEEQVLPMDHKPLLHVESKIPPKPLSAATSAPSSVQSEHPHYASRNIASAFQAGVTLTPELFATLASLIPSASRSSAIDGAKSAGGSSTGNSSFPTVALSEGNQSVLEKDLQIAEASSHPPQQFGSMYSLQSPHYNLHPSVSISALPAQAVTGSSYIQDSRDPRPSQQLQASVSTRSIANSMMPSQSGQIAVSAQVSKQYEVDVSPSAQKGYGVMQGAGVSDLYNSQVFEQPNTSGASYNEVYGANPAQQQAVMPNTADRANANLENNEVQSSPFGTGEGTSEVEADRSQRYQTTLQFAATLLRQIRQQHPQQEQTQGGYGPETEQ